MNQNKTMENKNWGFANVWNMSLEQREERPLKVRNNIWASELGKSPIDTWLKMRATPFTNPPNARSLRKFEAGNVFEWIVSLILKRAGILKESQKWSSFQYEGLIAVTGKADFIAGGKVRDLGLDVDFNLMGLPDVFMRGAYKIVEYLAKEYPDGLMEMPLEIKSISSFMFEAMEKKGAGSKIHRLQAYHYLKSENLERANLVYICRDDLRMMEFPILLNSPIEQEYRSAVEVISKYHLSNTKPPLEKEIVWDDDIGKFAKNFNVAYSSYLTMLYGYKDQMEFDDKFVSIVSRWNRVMARAKNGDKLTPKNEIVLKEIKDAGFSVDELVPKFAVSKSDEEE